jgi:tRNA(fMet)-specific endonuclease VapC
MNRPSPVRPLRWLLDTHIISEPTRPQPDAGVMQALLKHHAEMALPATALQEMHFGWLRMAEGRRKQQVGDYLTTIATNIPVLALDAAAARVQAELRWQAQQTGRPMAYADSEVAAIAIAQGLTLVTHNRRDFEGRPGLVCADWFLG